MTTNIYESALPGSLLRAGHVCRRWRHGAVWASAGTAASSSAAVRPAWMGRASRRSFVSFSGSGFLDGVQGAERDFQNHRIWNVNNRDEFRHPACSGECSRRLSRRLQARVLRDGAALQQRRRPAAKRVTTNAEDSCKEKPARVRRESLRTRAFVFVALFVWLSTTRSWNSRMERAKGAHRFVRCRRHTPGALRMCVELRGDQLVVLPAAPGQDVGEVGCSDAGSFSVSR